MVVVVGVYVWRDSTAWRVSKWGDKPAEADRRAGLYSTEARRPRAAGVTGEAMGGGSRGAQGVGRGDGG